MGIFTLFANPLHVRCMIVYWMVICTLEGENIFVLFLQRRREERSRRERYNTVWYFSALACCLWLPGIFSVP